MLDQEIQTSALVTDWGKVPVEAVADGIKRQMVVGERVMICRFTFDPWVVTDVHSHPHEQMTMVIAGKVKFTVDGHAVIAAPGDVLHFPPHNRHGASMLDEEVILIDVFSPIREDFLTRPAVPDGNGAGKLEPPGHSSHNGAADQRADQRDQT